MASRLISNEESTGHKKYISREKHDGDCGKPIAALSRMATSPSSHSDRVNESAEDALYSPAKFVAKVAMKRRLGNIICLHSII